MARVTTRCGSGSGSWTTCAPWARRSPPCSRSTTATGPGTAQRVTGSLLGGGVLTNSETFLDAAGTAAPVGHARPRARWAPRPAIGSIPLADGWIALCARDEGELGRHLRGPRGGRARRPRAGGGRRRRATPCWPRWHRLGCPCEPVRLDQGEAFLDDPLPAVTRPGDRLPPRRMGRAGAGRGVLGLSATSTSGSTGPRRHWASTPSRCSRKLGLAPDAVGAPWPPA